MMNSVAPFWDGNETWLVLGGGGLVGRVPAGLCGDHAGVLPAGDRDAAGAGVPRRRVRVPLGRRRPASATGISPSPPARRSPRFCQGVILGGLIQGIKVENGAFAGGAVRLGDAVRAAVRPRRGGRLRAARRDLAGDEDRRRGRRARPRAGQDRCCSAVLGFMAVVSLWTPLAVPRIAERWFSTAEHLLSLAGAAASPR